MPNWCSNDLVVSGKREAVEVFVSAIGGRKFDSEKFLPTPPELSGIIISADRYRNEEAYQKAMKGEGGPMTEAELAELQRKYGAKDWYEWSVRNLGTKWPFEAEYTVEHGKRRSRVHILSFDTAWSPPVPFVRQLSAKYPDMKFDLKYYESGMAFKGHYVCVGGVEQVNEEEPYRGSRGG